MLSRVALLRQLGPERAETTLRGAGQRFRDGVDEVDRQPLIEPHVVPLEERSETLMSDRVGTDHEFEGVQSLLDQRRELDVGSGSRSVQLPLRGSE